MAKKQKYYVVWQGGAPGVYDRWDDCERQVRGHKAARYKSFDTLAEAQEAFNRPFEEVLAECRQQRVQADLEEPYTGPGPEQDAIAVDAACSGNPGVMEYRGVYVATGSELFRYRAERGTNNIGEFLAIVHGLSYLKKHGLKQILYSDSVNAIGWVRARQCKSKLPLDASTADLWDYVHRAEAWLRENNYTTQILKWDTDHWGEIPADFGRKKQ
ncbi:MAG: ribonuclease H family protein [Bacteroidales bacterium]|nr:ribonuclease H family protein [Bacteroidales bacterium]